MVRLYTDVWLWWCVHTISLRPTDVEKHNRILCVSGRPTINLLTICKGRSVYGVYRSHSALRWTFRLVWCAFVMVNPGDPKTVRMYLLLRYTWDSRYWWAIGYTDSNPPTMSTMGCVGVCVGACVCVWGVCRYCGGGGCGGGRWGGGGRLYLLHVGLD